MLKKLACILVLAVSPAFQDKANQETDKSVDKAIKYLLSLKAEDLKKGSLDGMWGYFGMEVYAMAQCGVKKEKLVEYVERLAGGNISKKISEYDRDASLKYTLLSIALVSADPEKYKSEIETLAEKLIKCQKRGMFPYTNMPLTYPQMYPYNLYPYLALYILSEHNEKLVPAEIWQQAEKFFRGNQGGDGTWKYHMGNFGTHACAGTIIVGLANLKQNKKLKSKDFAADGTLAKTLGWLDSNFAPDKNPKAGGMYDDSYYFLHAAGVVAALTGRDQFGKQDWYKEGTKHILSTQKGDGSWIFQTRGHSDTLLDTAFAIMFLKKHFFVKWPSEK